MRAWVLLLASPLLAAACAETPRCVDRGTPETPRVVVECNTGKVPVCGTEVYDVETGIGTYDPNSGGLVRVPGMEGSTQLSCSDYPGYPGTVRCRPLPSCSGAGAAPACPANHGDPVCVVGMTQALAPPTMTQPPADGGTSEEDGGVAEQDGGTAEDDGGAGEEDAATPEDDAGAGD
jgi:hypothetical protein